MNYGFINGNITIFLPDGEVKNISSDHFNYGRVIEALKAGDYEKVLQLSEDKPENLINTTYAKHGVIFSIEEGTLYINGEAQYSYIAQRMKEFAIKGLPIDNLLEFSKRIQKNPSMRARDELYKFLESEHMPITDDGYFLGYKSVRADFKDWHSGKFDNSIGKTVKIKRSQVDDNADKFCSFGLHIGSYSYALNFHAGSNRQLIIAKVNPRDVVSVPNDDCRKLRCCQYQVMGLCKDKLEKSSYYIKDNEFYSNEDEDDYFWEDDLFWDS